MTDYSNWTVDQLEAEYKKILKERIKEQFTATSRLEKGDNTNLVANATFSQFKEDFIESMKNKEGISMTGEGYEAVLKRMVQGHYRRNKL